MISIDGVRPSQDLRAELSAAGAPVLLAFSCGKDALASWLALEDSGVTDIRPYYMYYVPGLRFVDEALDRFEQRFGRRIARYPHPALFRWIAHCVFQPPERLAVIEAADLAIPTYEQTTQLIKDDLGLDRATWVADGVRAADSIVRRMSITRHGPMKTRSRKVSVIWDWQKAEVLGRVERSGVALPPDYEWFGRSFDGIDFRFLEPLSRFAPDDYQRVLEWFPLADLELVRHQIVAA